MLVGLAWERGGGAFRHAGEAGGSVLVSIDAFARTRDGVVVVNLIDPGNRTVVDWRPIVGIGFSGSFASFGVPGAKKGDPEFRSRPRLSLLRLGPFFVTQTDPWRLTGRQGAA